MWRAWVSLSEGTPDAYFVLPQDADLLCLAAESSEGSDGASTSDPSCSRMTVEARDQICAFLEARQLPALDGSGTSAASGELNRHIEEPQTAAPNQSRPHL